MKSIDTIYVIMFQGIIDDIIDFWGESLQHQHGFFTDRKEAEKFRDELNAKNGFEYDIADNTKEYFYICELEQNNRVA